MRWWNDPDSLTPPLTADLLASTLGSIGREGGLAAVPGQAPTYVGTVWRLPARVTLLPELGAGPGPVVRTESLYDIGSDGGPDRVPDLTDDPAALRVALQSGSGTSLPLAYVRLVRLDGRHALHSLSWTPMSAGVHSVQLVRVMGTLLGSAAGALSDLAKRLRLPAAADLASPEAAARAWEAFDTARAPEDGAPLHRGQGL